MWCLVFALLRRGVRQVAVNTGKSLAHDGACSAGFVCGCNVSVLGAACFVFRSSPANNQTHACVSCGLRLHHAPPQHRPERICSVIELPQEQLGSSHARPRTRVVWLQLGGAPTILDALCWAV